MAMISYADFTGNTFNDSMFHDRCATCIEAEAIPLLLESCPHGPVWFKHFY